MDRDTICPVLIDEMQMSQLARDRTDIELRRFGLPLRSQRTDACPCRLSTYLAG
jgi:hypothetical protein